MQASSFSFCVCVFHAIALPGCYNHVPEKEVSSFHHSYMKHGKLLCLGERGERKSSNKCHSKQSFLQSKEVNSTETECCIQNSDITWVANSKTKAWQQYHSAASKRTLHVVYPLQPKVSKSFSPSYVLRTDELQ